MSHENQGKLIRDLHEAMQVVAEKSSLKDLPKPLEIAATMNRWNSKKGQRTVWADCMLAAYVLTHEKHAPNQPITTSNAPRWVRDMAITHHTNLEHALRHVREIMGQHGIQSQDNLAKRIVREVHPLFNAVTPPKAFTAQANTAFCRALINTMAEIAERKGVENIPKPFTTHPGMAFGEAIEYRRSIAYAVLAAFRIVYEHEAGKGREVHQPAWVTNMKTTYYGARSRVPELIEKLDLKHPSKATRTTEQVFLGSQPPIVIAKGTTTAQRILDVIRRSGTALKPREIANATGMHNVDAHLGELREAGAVEKVKGNKYRIRQRSE